MSEITQEYKLILADVAWHFRNWSADAPGMIHNRERGANKHYPTMSLEDVRNLDIPAADDCVLLFWVISSHMEEALDVIKAWDFTLKTKAWTWVKMTNDMSRPRMGMGYWTRQCTEDCWLATRGNPSAPAFRGEPGIILAPRGPRHSAKPLEQYAKIDRLFPDVHPRLELFARAQQPGWDVWGNEVQDSIRLDNKECTNSETSDSLLPSWRITTTRRKRSGRS